MDSNPFQIANFHSREVTPRNQRSSVNQHLTSGYQPNARLEGIHDFILYLLELHKEEKIDEDTLTYLLKESVSAHIEHEISSRVNEIVKNKLLTNSHFTSIFNYE